MLPKTYKLRNRKEIQISVRSKFRLYNQFFSLVGFKTKNPEAKFLAVVSKKISKKAPIRRRIQRRFYATILKNKLNLKIHNLNFVIVVKNQDIIKLNQLEFENLLLNTFKFLFKKYHLPK